MPMPDILFGLNRAKEGGKQGLRLFWSIQTALSEPKKLWLKAVRCSLRWPDCYFGFNNITVLAGNNLSFTYFQ